MTLRAIAVPALLAALILEAACAGAKTSTPTDEPDASIVTADCTRPQYDLSKESNYKAKYIHRWTSKEGCEVRLDVLMTRQGEEACGGSQVADILMGTPLGRPHDTSAARVYIKDPNNVFGDDETSDAYDADAQLPEDAVDSGYRQQGAALWITPDDDRFIYLVHDGSIEIWPRDDSPPGCA